MINICKPNGKLIKSFKSDDIFKHLSGGELLEDHPEIGATQWGFVGLWCTNTILDGLGPYGN